MTCSLTAEAFYTELQILQMSNYFGKCDPESSVSPAFSRSAMLDIFSRDTESLLICSGNFL